ncbi:site-specific integrase [Arenibacter sp. BSSL-BM3]|uniref:Site-specific integrase n=1 Tax=Arenibacter arenosicollis TaxID=2762274 RepID=A0ABR7QML7_9FLAO|nr:site-specific integrase [Arenibacter arenosicollis]MBC8768416.1 site-specific integrase [Arenibacter arenosicollis]
MPSISVLLSTVNENANVFRMKLNYSEPKIYTGGVDVNRWSSLTKKEQQQALDKDWFVYFSFRDPKTGRLKKRPQIKGGANRLKTKKERLTFLKIIQRNLLILLEAGFNPYKDNSDLEEDFLNGRLLNGKRSTSNTKTVEKAHLITEKSKAPKEKESVQNNMVSIKEAFGIALETKKQVLNQNSFSKYRSRINAFKKAMSELYSENDSITSITKKDVIGYLNETLTRTSARNRNNVRTDLSSFFQALEDNELIENNFIKKINILKAVPKRNKSYTPQIQKDITDYLEKNDTLLLLFVQFVCYNLLRPIEVCRLKIGDLDLNDRKIYVKAKNSPVKIKIIPEIMLAQIPDLTKKNKEHYLFTPYGLGGEWKVADNDKRNYFTKRFKKVKDHLGLGIDYGLYSFRHTFISKLYREFVKATTPFDAKTKLMLITGHTSMDALDKYLRNIDAALPEDYSNLLK